MKAKFNTAEILYGDTTYSEDFIDLVRKYENEIIEVEEEVFGGYELELEGRAYALDDKELVIINEQ